jgi:hypothetical protein
MIRDYDVWFCCTSCPCVECYEPTTRDKFLAGASKREAEYKRLDEKKKNEAAIEKERIKRMKSFAEKIRKKVEQNEVLSEIEFARAFRIAEGRDIHIYGFFSPTFLIGYQLSLLGYGSAAEEIVAYINSLLDPDW